jgi:large subunit ribosomal protein L23
VNIINVPGKRKRVRLQYGYTADWKKAVVTLKEGSKIEVA